MGLLQVCARVSRFPAALFHRELLSPAMSDVGLTHSGSGPARSDLESGCATSARAPSETRPYCRHPCATGRRAPGARGTWPSSVTYLSILLPRPPLGWLQRRSIIHQPQAPQLTDRHRYTRRLRRVRSEMIGGNCSPGRSPVGRTIRQRISVSRRSNASDQANLPAAQKLRLSSRKGQDRSARRVTEPSRIAAVTSQKPNEASHERATQRRRAT